MEATKVQTDLYEFETSVQKSRTDYMIMNRLGHSKITDLPWSL